MRVSVASITEVISKLPDVRSHRENHYVATALEPFDPDVDRPITIARTVTLLFKKNMLQDGWDLVLEETSCL